jgi:hypothetical protein
MKKYYAPTPAKWRKIGDSLLAASTTITTFAIYEKVDWLAYIALFSGVIGKFLSNLFSKG